MTDFTHHHTFSKSGSEDFNENEEGRPAPTAAKNKKLKVDSFAWKNIVESSGVNRYSEAFLGQHKLLFDVFSKHIFDIFSGFSWKNFWIYGQSNKWSHCKTYFK